MADLHQIDGYLFSEGLRDDPLPRRPAEESSFEFLDRVRQPAFERQRSWWEGAYGRYPSGPDKLDVGCRFRSSDEAQHFGAAWELAQHELWWRLGWNLTPHPSTPDGRRRDFLVEHQKHGAFFLECAVDLESGVRRKAERRWSVVEKALAELRSPHHQLLIDLRAIGEEPLATTRLRAEAQAALDLLPPGRTSVVLSVNRDGWHFTVRTTGRPASGRPALMQGGGRSLEERFYNPIRRRVIDKARGSAQLDKPFVVALLIMYPLPILSHPSVVQEALFGTTVMTLGPGLSSTSTASRRDGIWFDGDRFRRRGVSGLLLQQDIWPGEQLPTLHLHPGAERSFTAPVPLGVCRYEVNGGSALPVHAEASAKPRDVFDLPAEWPGPEDWFEGINNESPLPGPASWTPSQHSDRNLTYTDGSSAEGSRSPAAASRRIRTRVRAASGVNDGGHSGTTTRTSFADGRAGEVGESIGSLSRMEAMLARDRPLARARAAPATRY